MNYLKITILLLLIAPSSCSQDYQSKAELENEILGTWHYENDSKSKIVFSEKGIVKRYFGDELQSTGTYEISSSCDGEELPGKQFFLREYDNDGSSFCSYIEAGNYDNNGIFSLMTKEQGKIIVLKRDNS